MKSASLKSFGLKKLLPIFLAVVLTFSALSVVMPVSAVEKKPNLRFGAISDVHITSADGKCEGGVYFRKTLEYYKSRGVDAILIAGDIADSGKDYQTIATNNIFNEVFSDKETRPIKIFVPGNHDRFNGKPFDKMASDFATFFEEDQGAYIHKIVNGYDFVGISNGGDVATLRAFVKKSLDDAVKRDPNKPIFFTQHEHIAGTVYGSEGWSTNTLNDILKNYPQVVTFSGHSHFTLIDERSIHQKDFTSMGTSTLKYTELENGKENGSVPPNSSKVKEGLYIEVFDDKVNVERRSFFYDEKLGPNWELNLPLTKENFTYTDKRSEQIEAPVFDSNAKIEVNNVKRTTANITFDAATHSDFVHSYAIEAVRKGDTSGSEKLIFSDFYLGTNRMDQKIDYKVNGLAPGIEYTIKVYAIESFGKRSEPITTEIKTLESNITVDKFTPTILDVNLTDGTLKDFTYNKTKPQPNGTPIVAFDNELNKYVVKFDGKSHVNYYVDETELSSMGNQFTVEAVFKMNSIKNQTIIENTQGAGMGFESTGTGFVELWAYIGGKYNKIGVQLEKDKYYHLLGTYDGQKIYLYLDGKLVSEQAVSGSLQNPNGVPIALGADPDSNGGGVCLFDGNIALARVYTVAMNESDVQIALNNYKAMLNGKPLTAKVSLEQPQNGVIKLFSDELMTREITDFSKIQKNDLIYIKATPNKGYSLSTVKVNSQNLTTPGYVVSSDSVITAVFEKLPINYFKLTINTQKGGNVELFSNPELTQKINDLNEIIEGTKIYFKINCEKGYYAKAMLFNDVALTDDFVTILQDSVVNIKFILQGDANGDEKVSSTDALLILRHIVKIQTIDEKYKDNADFSRDGKITTVDALGIIKRIAGL